MIVTIKGTKIVLSEAPIRDIPDALLVHVHSPNEDFKFINVKRLQKEYSLPDKVKREDITAVYLRVL